MKKLLSVVLVLAMLASMMVYLPLGASAVETGTELYAEDFSGLEEGATYSLEELALELGWTLLRGEDSEVTVTVEDGALVIDASDATKDVVFEIANDAALKENHSIKYEKTQISYADAKTSFSGIYTGTDTGEKTTAFIAKTNNEGYAHLALADGSINEGNHASKGFKQTGSESLNQAQPSIVFYGGGFGKSTSTTSYEVIYDVENNQVDFYVSGARTLSTAGNPNMAKYNVADYVGEGAYLRVQKQRKTSFDNIAIVAGTSTVQDSLSGVVYEQNFDNITYDATTESAQDLANKIGFAMLTDGQTTGEAIYDGIKYAITDGQLDILFPAPNNSAGGGWSGWSTQKTFGQIYVPGMRYAQDTVTVEYDLTYTMTNQEGEIANGDSPLWFQIFGRHDGYSAAWGNTQKCWINFRIRGNSKDIFASNMRPESHGHMLNRTSYTFANGSYSFNIMERTDHYKLIMSKTEGVMLYVNDVLTWRMTDAQLSTATNNWDAYVNDIFGACNIRLLSVRGMHCLLDNMKIEIDPAKETPELLITEAGASGVQGNGNYEYVEVYNNSDDPVNIYDYAVVNKNWNEGRANNTSVNLDDIHLLYPGAHTFKSIKTDETTGESLYSITHTNPAYEEGWIQPGEVVLLWNTTNAMHNSGYSDPKDITWTCTVDGFRTQNKVPEGVKVFMMYNDYNRAFNNSGHYALGLAERAMFQPDYDPATGTGDETLASVTLNWNDLVSYIYMTAYGVKRDASSTGGNAQKRPVAPNVTIDSAGAAASFRYENNNTTLAGLTPEGKMLTNVLADLNPGVVNDNQKRTVNVVLNGKSTEVFLGEAVDLTATEGFQKLLFAEVNGAIVADTSYTVTGKDEGAAINVVTIAMETAPKAYARLYAESTEKFAGLRFIHAIDGAALAALAEDARISGIEFGTLMIKEEDLVDDVTLTLDNVTADNGADGNVVRKVVATADSWYTKTAEDDYNGLNLFAGGIGSLKQENLTIGYVGCSYLTMTVEGVGVVTVYGQAHTAVAEEILFAALTDLENAGITEGADYDAINFNLDSIE